MSARERAKGMKLPTKKPAVWAGPESDADNGGITFSLLSRFLCCRERFRLLVVEGLKPREEFNHRLEYGNLWHVCEEAFAAFGNKPMVTRFGRTEWEGRLTDEARTLCRKYPTQQEQVQHWYNVCKVQFPLYVEHWSRHPDVTNREPLLSEEVFKVPYTLPSGRVVYLRGKWDSVDLVTHRRQKGIWLQENKSKGDIKPELLQRQLTFDLQVMLYAIALREAIKGGVVL